MQQKNRKYALISIATNIYVEYWQELVLSVDKVLKDPSILQIVLFTDQLPEMKKWSEDLKSKIDFLFIDIPSYVWPEATLYRYSIISKSMNLINSEICIYIDADMKFESDLIQELEEMEIDNRMYFAPHPGFKIEKSATTYSYEKLRRKLLRFFSTKHKGSWERNPNSTAFVSNKKRKIYLHGAIWLGRRDIYKHFINECAENVDTDWNRGIIAKWHDESHLNAFFVHSGGNILSSRFSWHPAYHKTLLPHPIVKSVDHHGKTR